MSIPKKIAINTIFSSSAKIIWTLIAMVSLGLITRHLGTASFGDYTTILAFFFMLSALCDMGLGQIVLREISYKSREKDERHIVSVAFTMRLVVSLVLILASLVLVWVLPYSSDVKKGILLVSVGLIFSSGYQNCHRYQSAISFKSNLSQAPLGRFGS